MSDGTVQAAIEQMEAWLADPTWEPDAEAIAQWHASFQGAMAGAEKGTGWPALVARGHLAGEGLNSRWHALAEEQDRIKTQLDAQERGDRALKGYGASAR